MQIGFQSKKNNNNNKKNRMASNVGPDETALDETALNQPSHLDHTVCTLIGFGLPG